MDKLVSATLADVAAHAGVSLATASRVLNGSTRRVGADNAERVRSSAKVLRYSTNVQAQAVARGSSAVVALVVGDLADPYFASIASGVVAEADAAGMTVTVVPATGPESDSKVGQLLLGMRPKAAVFASGRRTGRADDAHTQLIDELIVRGIRPIAISSDDDRLAVRDTTVRVANRGGACELGAALTEIGYSSFAVLAADFEQVTARARVEGFLEGIGDAHVATVAGEPHGRLGRDAGYRQMRLLLDMGPAPECVFAPADVMALGALRAIRERGLTPGADVGIAGFDDIPTLVDVTPGLTTVRLPLEELGRRTVRAALNDDWDDAPLTGTVVLRDSTPPLVVRQSR